MTIPTCDISMTQSKSTNKNQSNIKMSQMVSLLYVHSVRSPSVPTASITLPHSSFVCSLSIVLRSCPCLFREITPANSCIKMWALGLFFFFFVALKESLFSVRCDVIMFLRGWVWRKSCGCLCESRVVEKHFLIFAVMKLFVFFRQKCISFVERWVAIRRDKMQVFC